jgi:hypothetical protein
MAFKERMWPVGEGERSVRVEQDVARVPDYYPATLNVDREPALFVAAVCIEEAHVVVTLAKHIIFALSVPTTL